MQLPVRVRAKAGVLVPVPRLGGGTAQYVGRAIDHKAFEAGETDLEKLYPISKEAEEFSPVVHGHAVFSEIKREIMQGNLLVELKAPSAPASAQAPEPAQTEPTSAEPRAARSKG